MLSVRHPAYRYHPPDIQTRRGRPSKKHHRAAHSLSHKPAFGPNARPPRTDSPYCRRVALGMAVGAHAHRIPYMHSGLHTLAPFIFPAATIWPRRTLHAQTALTAGVPRHSAASFLSRNYRGDCVEIHRFLGLGHGGGLTRRTRRAGRGCRRSLSLPQVTNRRQGERGESTTRASTRRGVCEGVHWALCGP